MPLWGVIVVFVRSGFLSLARTDVRQESDKSSSTCEDKGLQNGYVNVDALWYERHKMHRIGLVCQCSQETADEMSRKWISHQASDLSARRRSLGSGVTANGQEKVVEAAAGCDNINDNIR